MIINCRMEKSDNFEVDDTASIVNFFEPKSFSYTFWNNQNKFPSWYSPQALDLLYISMSVFAADRKERRNNAPDGWSRTFVIYIPVLEYDLWIVAKDNLEKMLSFLSGDKWIFNFRKRKESAQEKKQFNKWEKSKKSEKMYSQLCMFSGGLDSFIGAIDQLEAGNKDTLFVSHYGGGKGTKEFQDRLKKKIIEEYDLEEIGFNQYHAKVLGGVEDTTRTRSFMFFSHALALASCFRKKIPLIIPENGFISLNIPSTYSRIGTSSTRTTHPYYMQQFQILLDTIKLPVTLVNPYQFKTKGEMIIECKNRKFLEVNLINTMSCSHPDNGRMLKEKEAQHCGYCLPCVIRQAANKRAGILDNSLYRDNKFTGGPTAKTCLNSYRLGLKKYNFKYAFMTIQLSGPIYDDTDEYAKLYIRGMDELESYLKEI